MGIAKFEFNKHLAPTAMLRIFDNVFGVFLELIDGIEYTGDPNCFRRNLMVGKWLKLFTD